MLFGPGASPARRPLKLSTKLLIASLAATVMGFSAICVDVMLDMRRGEMELARKTLENLGTSIESDINRNIEIYDLSLRAVASNMLMPEIGSVSKPVQHLILFDHATRARHFGGIQVFDATGHLIIDATTLDPLPEDRSDEEYFTAHRDNPDAGLFISRPMLHRSAYSIVLSRRISGTDGQFLGVVAGSIRFSYFHDLFDQLRLDPDDTITVLRRDRTVIMRRPFDLDVIGKNLGEWRRWNPANLAEGGSYAGPGPLDSTPRLFVRTAATGPLFVVVGKPVSSVLNLWYTEVIRIGSIVLVLTLIVLASSIILAREIGRRAQAEEKLTEMATTDALTGLKNRRKFDQVIDEEWRRAMRNHTPISLLMIDADHFKAYNDTFGHQAGDQVLAGIAVCISDSVQRAGDCAARYGGEEFAVLLPGTAEADALKVAETIRLKVLSWSDEPSKSTVSIGIASVTPRGGMASCILVTAADKALYAAKAGGRNKSVVADIPKLPLAA